MINEFIEKRFKSDNTWLEGNCYWFAFILCERFPELELYYEPIAGHFYAGNGKEFYDFTGEVKPKHFPKKFIDIRKEDISWYERIVRDCIL